MNRNKYIILFLITIQNIIDCKLIQNLKYFNELDGINPNSILNAKNDNYNNQNGVNLNGLITSSSYNSNNNARVVNTNSNEFTKINPNQIIIFNIGDSRPLEFSSSSYKQKFDQETINYCNFDPNLLTNKRKTAQQLFAAGNNNNQQTDFNINIFLKGETFNETSQITVRIQFLNQQAQSSQLWYLLEAKTVCKNEVVGTWRLTQQQTTDTIYCFNRDDTVFGHKNNIEETIFDQVWLPANTKEDIYFVIAIFTDETNSLTNPSYYILSSPIYKYDPNSLRSSSGSYDYESICSVNQNKKPATFNIIPKEPVNSVFIIPTPTPKIEPTSSAPKPTTTTILSTKTSKPTETTQTTTSNRISITNSKLTHKHISKTIKTDKVTDKVNVIKMSTSLNQINLSKERSILVNLIAKTSDCSFDFLSHENDIKSKLENIYKNITSFDSVVIKNIRNAGCLATKNSKRQLDANEYNVSIQHYVIFNTPLKNITKIQTINSLKNYLTTDIMDNLQLYDSRMIESDGSEIAFNNPCSMYNYFKICQNNGICKLNQELAPTCSCPVYDQNFYFTGDYCETKIQQQLDSDKIKMLIVVCVLALFAIISLLSLLMYIFYKRKQQRGIIKRYPSKFLISDSSSSCASSNTKNILIDHQNQRHNMNIHKQLANLRYDSTEYLSAGDYIRQMGLPFELKTENNPINNNLRHCFSLRNSALTLNNQNTSSTASSDIYTDYEERNLIKSKGLVCLTDGSSTSYKIINDNNINANENNLIAKSSSIIYNNSSNYAASNGYFHNAKALMNKSQNSNSTSTSTSSPPTYSPRLGNQRGNDDLINTLSYPREITIASTPLKMVKKSSSSSSKKQQQLKKSKIESYDNSHINFAYDMTYSSQLPFETQSANNIINVNNISSVNVRRESSQHLPQSIEKQMARNLQHLTHLPQASNNTNTNNNTSSQEMSIENTNLTSKYTDSTSLPSVDQSLKDEDAWLPILNIVEEQILKYEAEKLKDSEFYLI